MYSNCNYMPTLSDARNFQYSQYSCLGLSSGSSSMYHHTYSQYFKTYFYFMCIRVLLARM